LARVIRRLFFTAEKTFFHCGKGSADRPSGKRRSFDPDTFFISSLYAF
jgi:hypothetical protein